MSAYIDLNADLGESEEAADIARDIAIMDIVSSVNIACGGHAGSRETMAAMVAAAASKRICAGAHPSYPDRANFGRIRMDIAAGELFASLCEQITALSETADICGSRLTHVKPHGALYNDAADDIALAALIATAAKHCLRDTALVGLAGGAMADAAKDAGLKFVAEAFVDRRYNANSRLVSRKDPGAVLENEAERSQQALALAMQQPVTSASGEPIYIFADSLCLHSDSDGALKTAHAVRAALERSGVEIASPL